MARGAVTIRRPDVPNDVRYGSQTVTKFINYVMVDGKKRTAEKIVYTALESASATLGAPALDVLEQVLSNIMPVVEVRGRRVGGANLQVPMEVPKNRRLQLGMRWLLAAARGKKGKAMHIKLAEELVAAYNNEGAAVRKREDTHKQAEANRAFAHFARRRS